MQNLVISLVLCVHTVFDRILLNCWVFVTECGKFVAWWVFLCLFKIISINWDAEINFRVATNYIIQTHLVCRCPCLSTLHPSFEQFTKPSEMCFPFFSVNVCNVVLINEIKKSFNRTNWNHRQRFVSLGNKRQHVFANRSEVNNSWTFRQSDNLHHIDAHTSQNV